MIWFVAICLTLVTAWFVLAPLLRPVKAVDDKADVAVYKAQLDEVERDVARGVLSEEDAERTKVEVSRRLIAAAKSDNSPSIKSKTLSSVQLIVATFCIGLVSVGTYWAVGAPQEPDQPLAQRIEQAALMRENRPNQAAMVAAAPPKPAVDAPAEYLESVEQLRILVPTRPGDLKGWELLAFHEAELLNFDAAAQAQAKVVALKDPTELSDLIRLLDLMVFAANGFVSPEAEAVAADILERDSGNFAARYYYGSLNDQTGRPDRAFGLWRPLVESGADTFHIALARRQIPSAAARAGIDYELPQFAGPDLATIAAADELSPEERDEMVKGMVEQLSNRLATQGGTATEWARLIRAHAVQGDQNKAEAVYREAVQVFSADEAAIAALTAAADFAGISQ